MLHFLECLRYRPLHKILHNMIKSYKLSKGIVAGLMPYSTT